MIKRYLPICLALFSLPLLSSCGSSGNPTLAVVGDYKITLEEFNGYFNSSRYQYASADEEYNRKREMLDSIVITRLLIDEAYEKNIDKLEELARIVLANRNQFLRDALYKTRIIEGSDPSDAELKEFYNKLEYQVRAAHILVKDADTADALLQRLRGGENFEKLAYEYSIDPTAKKNRGDLGYFLWGALADKFQEIAFSIEPGEISPPVKTRFGYHIIKVVDRVPNDLRGDFDTVKDSLKIRLTGMKRQRRMYEFLDSLKVACNIAVDTATCEYLLYKRKELYPQEILADLPKNDFDLEALDRNEKELVLATWDGGQITLIEYLTLVQRIPVAQRPDFDDFDSLSSFIYRIKSNDILALEAARAGLDQEKYFMENIKKFKELNMADIMRNDSIPKPLPPTEEEARTYYDANPQEFTQPMKVHVYEIYLSDELKARKLRNEIKSLAEFREKAMDLTERPGKRSVGGDLQYIERRWYPEIFDLAQKTSAGSIAGPVLTRGKYAVIWVEDKLPEQLQDFLTVKNDIMNRLAREAYANAFGNWVEQKKSGSDVTYNEDALWSTVDKQRYAFQDTSTSEG